MKNIFTLFLILNTIWLTSAQRNVVLIIADDLGSNWCGFQENRPKLYFKVMAEAMDNRIGKIYEWLQANNKMDSTDIIFIGDNGNTQRTAQVMPTIRSKETVYQEGIHVPFIISGPHLQNPILPLIPLKILFLLVLKMVYRLIFR